MTNKLFIQCRHDNYEVVLTENDHITQYIVHQQERESSKGNIYRAKVMDILPGMEAAFVDIGQDKNAFLHIDDAYLGPKGLRGGKGIRDILRKGEQFLVQVTKDDVANKGAKVTRNLWFSAKKIVYLPFGQYVSTSRRIEETLEKERLIQIGHQLVRASEGLIIRTQAQGASQQELEEELEGLRLQWQELQQHWQDSLTPLIYRGEHWLDAVMEAAIQSNVQHCLVDDPGVYQLLREQLEEQSDFAQGVELYQGKQSLFKKYNLQAKLEKVLRPKQWLKSGGHIYIQPTEALTVIDVNTGKNVGKKSLRETIYVTNVEAAQEIARQLRLRDIGGLIVIDFIDMEQEEDRQGLLEKLNCFLERDRTVTYVAGLTSLGLVEMTRKKVRRSFYETSTTTCSTCQGEGFVRSGI